MVKLNVLTLFLLFTTEIYASLPELKPEEKPRVIVLTDISANSGDPDDKQSLVRLLLYANDLDIEGLIATSVETSKKDQRGDPEPAEIISRVKAYGQVLNKLRRHSSAYPSEAYLLSVIRKGTLTGRKFGSAIIANGWPVEEVIGKGKDTEASDLIIQLIDKNDPRPIWICVWGGPMDLAQALWRIRNDRSVDEVKKAISRIRVYAWGHQDLGGQWIRDHFPDLFYINSTAGVFYTADPYLCSVNWLNTNVRKNHGPLGALCPIRDPGLGEGDTETYLGLIPNGLSYMEHPDWSGWGGRMKPDPQDPNMWVDLTLDKSFKDASIFERIKTSEHSTIVRWAPEFQNDYQARMDWCVNDFKNANHSPKVIVNGDSSPNPIYYSGKPGQKIVFDAGESTDPDGDLLFYRWFIDEEISTIKGAIIKHEKKQFHEADGYGSRTPEWEKATISLPEDCKGVLHLILQCTDYGSPALSRYRRMVINVE